MNKTILSIGTLVVALTLLSSFALIPAAHAYGKANWQVGFSGTFLAVPTAGIPGLTVEGGGFWGWCDFVGISSGTSADCQVSNYMHIVASSGVFAVTCETSYDVTSWNTQLSAPPPVGTGLSDFFFISGTTTVHPLSNAICQSVFGTFPVGDQFIPAVAGHYNMNAHPYQGFLLESQTQVTQLP
jgi:hypothetical protein